MALNHFHTGFTIAKANITAKKERIPAMTGEIIDIITGSANLTNAQPVTPTTERTKPPATILVPLVFLLISEREVSPLARNLGIIPVLMT
jgi:hypothetical protein